MRINQQFSAGGQVGCGRQKAGGECTTTDVRERLIRFPLPASRFPQYNPPMKPMYLPEVEQHPPPEPYATRFRMMRDAGLPIPQIQHLFAFKPDRTEFLSRFTQGVMRGPSPLPPWQRELIAAFTSKLNQCLF